ncbi:MAG TPA: histidine kinase, partial [Bacteroidia bacterium]|nr:histidine kinase [Bacteroidia bacterium]
MHRNWKLILIHLVGALGFLAIPILISPDFFLGRAFWLSRGFRVEMAIYVLMLGFFYLHYYVLVPRLYYRKRWWQYILALAAVLVLTVALPLLLVGEFGHPTDHPRHFSPSVEGQPPHLGPPMRFFIARTMAVVTGLFLVVVFFSLLLRASRRLKEMEEEKMHAQLAYLKAQINPHFLFNTLNSIYAMAIEKSDATADAVVKLSGMMRFVITEGDRDHVPLEKELGYVRDYIDLQRLRLGDTATIDFEVKGQPANLQIAPLIII